MRKIPPMAIPPHDPGPRKQAAEAAAQRDAGVRRVRSTTRWLAAGAIGLTGALAGVVSQQGLPAKAATTSSGAGAAPAGAASDSSGYAQSQDEGSYGSDEGSSGYDDGSGGYGYDDGGSYSGAPQAPQEAPQQAPQSVAPSTSSGAS